MNVPTREELLDENRTLRIQLDMLRSQLATKTDNQVADPWLTREQAEAHLNFSRTAFFRARRQFPDELKPCNEHPLRWSRNALDVFKMKRGVAIVRPGRRRQ